ncbi:hypothetical protein ACFL6E_00525 [Candidatus Neomarinimicrobiota bacterium]
MLKRIIFVLAIAALFTTCEEDPLGDIPSLEGQWILSRSVWTITHNDTLVDSGDESFATNDPLNYEMVLNIDASNVSFCENDPSTIEYSCVVETPYEQLTDSIMIINDDDGIPEEVIYAATSNTFLIYFDGEEEMDGVIYQRESIEYFVKYTGSWPPAEWTTAQESLFEDLTGQWVQSRSVWTISLNGTVVESADHTYSTDDPLDFEMVLDIDADNVSFCENDTYTTEYTCVIETAYEQLTDSTMIVYDDDGNPEEVRYHATENSFTIYFEGEEEYDGVIYQRESAETFVRYTGSWPPAEWGIAQEDPSGGLIGQWLTESGREYLTDADGNELISRGDDPIDISDPYAWEQILEFTETSIISYENDWGSGDYYSETGSYETEGDSIFLHMPNEDGSTEDMNMIYEVTDPGITLRFTGTELETHDGVTGYGNMEINFIPYPGTTFPPPEWLVPGPNDDYEPDSTYDLATAIVVDAEPQVHALVTDDQDWFVFTAVAAQTYLFEIEGRVKTQMEVYTDPASGNPENLQWIEEMQATVWTSTTAGPCYIVVKQDLEAAQQYDEPATGRYTIEVMTATLTSPPRGTLGKKAHKRSGIFGR